MQYANLASRMKADKSLTRWRAVLQELRLNDEDEDAIAFTSYFLICERNMEAAILLEKAERLSLYRWSHEDLVEHLSRHSLGEEINRALTERSIEMLLRLQFIHEEPMIHCKATAPHYLISTVNIHAALDALFKPKNLKRGRRA